MIAKIRLSNKAQVSSAYGQLIDWGVPARPIEFGEDWECLSILIDQTNLTPLQQKNLELTYGVEWCKISIDDVKLREEW